MAASATDKFQKVAIATATTLDAPGYTIGATSVTVASTSTWPTDTGITFAMDEVDANGDRVAGSYNEYVGTVATGTSVTNVTHVNGTDRNYTAGTTTRVYIPVSEERENRLVEGILVHADQDGTLKAGAVDAAAVLANDVVTTTKILDSNVTTAKIADSNITSAKAASGFVVGFGYAGLATSGTTTTVIPGDITIPQITEGTELVTLSYTPKSATSTLLIEAQVMLITAGTAYAGIAALFVDATTDAIGADAVSGDQGGPMAARPYAVVSAGSTSARTYRLRVGPSAAGTVRWNGSAGQWFGAIEKTCIRVTEFKG